MNLHFIILSVYRSPLGDLNIFLLKLDEVLIFITKKFPKADIILCSDHNIDLLKQSPSQSKLLDLVHSFNIKETIVTPTRVTATSSSLIDNIFTTIDPTMFLASSTDTGLSDHHLLMLNISLSNNNPSSKIKIMKRFFNTKNTASFQTMLSTENWQSLSLPGNVDELLSRFHSTFLCHFNKSFPLKSCNLTKPKVNPWISHDLRSEAQTLRSLHSKLKSSNNPIHKEQYRDLKKSHAKNIRQAKLHYNDSKISESRNTSKAIWSMIKSQTTASKPKCDLTLTINGEVISDASSQCELFNEFFINSCNIGRPNVPSNTPLPRKPLPPPLGHTIFLYPTTPLEVAMVIRKFGSKHSYGLDEVPGSLLSKCTDFISGPLAYIINRSFSEGIFPSKLKAAKIIPIYKHKGKKSEMTNYRPISLLSSFSKIFEYIMHDRLISFLNHHKIISPSQHGFLKNKSTTSAIYSFLSPLYSALDKGDQAVGLFYDMTKAFDTIDHKILLDKLHTYGIRGVALDWISSFLSGRTQVVELQTSNSRSVTTTRSKPLSIVCGVPQGSILGPLAYIIYVNDQSAYLEEGTLTQYADDSSQLLTLPKLQPIQDLPPLINNQVTLMSSYCRSKQLTISRSKTVYLYFHTPYKIPTASPLVRLDSDTIPRAHSVKVLGLALTDNLDWSIHVNHVASKILSGCYSIRKLKQIVHPHILLLVYFAHIHSHLSYGLLFWGASPHANRIFILQKRAVRIIAGVSRKHSCRELFKELGILTLACTLIQSAALFVRTNRNLFHLNASVHSYNTRANHHIHRPSHNLRLFAQGPEYLASTLYNKLPDHIKTSPTLPSFKHKLKSYLTANSFYSINDYLSM